MVLNHLLNGMVLQVGKTLVNNPLRKPYFLVGILRFPMRKCCHVLFFWGVVIHYPSQDLTSVPPYSGNKLVGGLTGHDDVTSVVT